MMRLRFARLTLLIGAAVLLVATAGFADSWDEKTVLTFDEAVAVPGASLKAGTYVFRIAQADSSRHVIQVFTDGSEELLATFQAVPMRRAEPTDEIVVTFAATRGDAPPAVKGWFYPGRQFGHEFVYPEEQARKIAADSTAVVLSVDTSDSDIKKGTLHSIDAAGHHTDWHGDSTMMNEWNRWQANRSKGDSAAASAR